MGLVPPALSAVLHNGTTVLTSLRSLRPYMAAPRADSAEGQKMLPEGRTSSTQIRPW